MWIVQVTGASIRGIEGLLEVEYHGPFEDINKASNFALTRPSKATLIIRLQGS
jgi:hypothetical protein